VLLLQGPLSSSAIQARVERLYSGRSEKGFRSEGAGDAEGEEGVFTDETLVETASRMRTKQRAA